MVFKMKTKDDLIQDLKDLFELRKEITLMEVKLQDIRNKIDTDIFNITLDLNS